MDALAEVARFDRNKLDHRRADLNSTTSQDRIDAEPTKTELSIAARKASFFWPGP